MGKTKNIIEINGKRYDATTGAALDHISAPKKAVSHPAPTKSTMHDVVRRKAGKHAIAHAPTQAQTLMRRAVKKPAATNHKQHAKATSPTNTLAKRTLAEVAVNPSVRRLNEERLKHAERVAKSRLVSHFSPETEIGFGQPVAVPTTLPIHTIAPTHTPAAHKQAKPSTTADMLERALQHATSHEQPAPKHLKHSRRRSRKLGIVAATGASLLFVAFVASQGVPSMRMHMASAKAGFSGSLPDYKPAGYSLGKFDYSQGEIATNFHSNSNDASYTLIQKPSTLDSAGLRENLVAQADPSYRTEESGGRTVFFYGNGMAAWVNAGTLYQLQSDGSLSDRQLLQIASSL